MNKTAVIIAILFLAIIIYKVVYVLMDMDGRIKKKKKKDGFITSKIKNKLNLSERNNSVSVDVEEKNDIEELKEWHKSFTENNNIENNSKKKENNDGRKHYTFR